MEILPALFSIESNYNGVYRNGINSSFLIKKEFKKLYPEANEAEKEEFGIVISYHIYGISSS